MPRKARQKSCSGFVHVIVRGIGKQILFEETSDYLFFLSILKKNAPENNIIICAYCMMDNHVHLLLFDEEQHLPVFMKKIGVSYAVYYNQKYQRIGHVFQDRYKSEVVETSASLLRVFRYILKNPEKAGICPAAEYRWSSFHCFGRSDTFVDTSAAAGLIGGWEEYVRFLQADDHDQCMEYTLARKTDEEAKEIIRRIGLSSGTSVQSFSREDRNTVIEIMLQEGLSVRQIERLTGISRGIIQRLKR